MITRPAPSAPRRKSMERSSRTPPPAAVATAPEGAAPAPARAALPPSMTMMLLPSTRVSYGTSLSRFSTRRVRSLVSAASMVSRPEACTSMRREDSASVVLGRSKEMRAGLSMVNDSGCGAGPDRRRVSCSCCPGRGCTSMACRAG